MTARRPVRTPRSKRPAETPAPISKQAASARKLPNSGPGLVTRIPLSLLPEYLELHSLVPSGRREPKVQPEKGPGEAILIVKRIRKGAM